MLEFRLKVFNSVAKHLSFTKAAQELFISQPAISKHIRELEAQYKTRLFERLGNRISLTASGQLLLEHSERILNEFSRLEYDMSLLRGEYGGTLCLGASTTISQYLLPPLLARFVEKFPDVSLTLVNGNSEEIERALEEHRIDLGLVEGNIRRPHLKYTRFMKDELVPVVRPDSPWASRDEITIDELRTIPLVMRERGSGTLDVLSSELLRLNVRMSDLNILMYLGSTESIKLFIKNSRAMGFVSVRSIAEELYRGELKVVDVAGMEMNREFDFVQLHGEDAGLSKLFMDFAFRYNERL